MRFEIEDMDLFTRLSRFIRWSAKYKVPVNNIEFEKSVGSMKLKETDFKIVEDIIEKLQLDSGFRKDVGWP